MIGLAFRDVFTSDFAQLVWSGVLAGLIVALAAYVVIERRLRLQETGRARLHTNRVVLAIVKGELEHNLDQAILFEKHLPKDEMPWPAFDVNGWTLISQASVFTVLTDETLEALVPLYNRLRTAAEYHTSVNEIMFGLQGLIAFALVRGLTVMTPAVGTELSNLFAAKRDEHRDNMLDRVLEMKPLLERTTGLLAKELERIDALEKPGRITRALKRARL